LGERIHTSGVDDDLRIIKKYQEKRDTAILSPLFIKYNPLIFGVCMKYVKDSELSKDLTMDIFEKLVTDLQTQEIKNFKSWLYVIVKNHCLMYFRKEKKRMANQEEFEKNTATFMENHQDWHPFNSDQEGIMRMILKSCLEKLEKDQKTSIDMFYLDRKTYQEISEVMQIELKLVKSHIQNGRRNLKICLDRKLKRMSTD
jgi:RNA polymerase sigma-70 factor (ECF subfamily)